MKAIETIFMGYRFRSRLEARWATFFNSLGTLFEYEKEGYDLGDTGWYLPDFWLPTVGLRSDLDTGVWVEIKPNMPSDAENAKCWGLTMATGRPVLLFVGLPCSWMGSDRGKGTPATDNGYQYTEGFWDNCMSFIQCHSPNCGYVKVEFEEGNYMQCPKCGAAATGESEGLQRAYEAAKGARFERH